MKRVYMPWLLLGCVILMSHHYAPEGSPSVNHLKKREETMNNSQNKETVRKFYEECLNKKDFVLMRELLSPDFTGANGEKGAEGFEKNVKPLMTGLPDVQWKIEDIIQEGDKVAVRHSLKGTNTGVYRGLPPTGKVITNDGILIFQLKGDKIIAVWTQTDRLGFNQQIGIIPMTLIPASPQK
jgi:predicted ester cyclase